MAAHNFIQFLSVVPARRSGSMAAPPPPSADNLSTESRDKTCELRKGTGYLFPKTKNYRRQKESTMIAK